MTKYLVHEYDFVFNQRVSDSKEFTDIKEALKYAKGLASQWCEDEKPTVRHDKTMDYYLVAGEADFGARVTIH